MENNSITCIPGTIDSLMNPVLCLISLSRKGVMHRLLPIALSIAVIHSRPQEKMAHALLYDALSVLEKRMSLIF